MDGLEKEEAATPDSAAAAASEAARACLYAVVERFNTEDPFWGAFVPELDSTSFGDDRFSVALHGRGVRLEVKGVMLTDNDKPGVVTPSLVVGACGQAAGAGVRRWHPITCTVDANGRFATSNFRKAIEAAIDDLQATRRS